MTQSACLHPLDVVARGPLLGSADDRALGCWSRSRLLRPEPAVPLPLRALQPPHVLTRHARSHDGSRSPCVLRTVLHPRRSLAPARCNTGRRRHPDLHQPVSPTAVALNGPRARPPTVGTPSVIVHVVMVAWKASQDHSSRDREPYGEDEQDEHLHGVAPIAFAGETRQGLTAMNRTGIWPHVYRLRCYRDRLWHASRVPLTSLFIAR